MSMFPNEAQLQKALAYINAPEGTVDIAPDLKEQVDRWAYADQLIRRHGDIGQVIGLLKRHYKYSEATARRDINSATYLYGSLHHVEVKYWQRFSMELLVRAMTRADAAGNDKGLAALNREFRETVGINAKNQGIPLPGQLQRHTFIITDDYRGEDEGFLTREEVERQTELLLAKYKALDEPTREITISPGDAGA